MGRAWLAASEPRHTRLGYKAASTLPPTNVPNLLQ